MARQPESKAVQAHYATLAETYTKRANKACDQAYRRLVREHLSNADAVLEIGCGATPLAKETRAALQVGCDMSVSMLRGIPDGTLARCVADAERLPFPPHSFDAAICVNVLEHTGDPARLLGDAARILKPGGTLVAVTPNGRHEGLLDLLEKLHLKLPEGPHRFLSAPDLFDACAGAFEEVRVSTFLAVPAGPPFAVRIVDAIAPFGLFLRLVARTAQRA